MKAQLVILGEREVTVFAIQSFSMIEPSTNTIRFETTDGVGLESRGSPFLITAGDINALPPFQFKTPRPSDHDDCGHNQMTWNAPGQYWQCAKCGHVYGSIGHTAPTANPQFN